MALTSAEVAMLREMHARGELSFSPTAFEVDGKP